MHNPNMNSEILRAALDSIDDGVVVMARDGGVLYANSRFNAIWGMPSDWVPSTSEQVFSDIAPRVLDPVTSGARFRYLRENLDERSYDLLELKDGRLIERLAVPLRIEKRTEGKIWVYRDLIDRLQFEGFGNDRAAANGELAGLAIDIARELTAGRLPWASALFVTLLEIGETTLRVLAETGGRYAVVDVDSCKNYFSALVASLLAPAPDCLRGLSLDTRSEPTLPTTAINEAALVAGLIPVEILRARMNAAPPATSACLVRLRGAGNSIVVAHDPTLAWSDPASNAQELVAHARETALLARFSLAFSRLSGFASVKGRADSEAFRFEATSAPA